MAAAPLRRVLKISPGSTIIFDGPLVQQQRVCVFRVLPGSADKARHTESYHQHAVYGGKREKC